jgi:hypothetical protein
VRRVLSFLLALVVAFAGVVGLLLLLQSRDEPTLERQAPITRPQTAP